MRENGCELDKTAVSAKVYAASALTEFSRLTFYVFCVNIYAKCVHHLSSRPFSRQFGRRSWRRRCCLPKGPGIFPNWQHTLRLRHRAFSGNLKPLPKAESCKGGKKAADSTTEQNLSHPFSRSSAIGFLKPQGV